MRSVGSRRCIHAGTLERAVVEKMILRVSQMHECQFRVSSHVAMMTQLGISTDRTWRDAFATRTARDGIR